MCAPVLITTPVHTFVDREYKESCNQLTLLLLRHRTGPPTPLRLPRDELLLLLPVIPLLVPLLPAVVLLVVGRGRDGHDDGDGRAEPDALHQEEDEAEQGQQAAHN